MFLRNCSFLFLIITQLFSFSLNFHLNQLRQLTFDFRSSISIVLLWIRVECRERRGSSLDCTHIDIYTTQTFRSTVYIPRAVKSYFIWHSSSSKQLQDIYCFEIESGKPIYPNVYYIIYIGGFCIRTNQRGLHSISFVSLYWCNIQL